MASDRAVRSRRAAWFAVLTCALLSACMSPPPAPPYSAVPVTTGAPPPPPAVSATAEGYPQLGGDAPGSLVNVTPFDTIDPRITATGASAWRLRYITTSAIENRPVETTGVVLIPGGEPPAGGWRVIAYNHGNTGINNDCGPSLYDDLLNQWGTTSVLLLDGYVVVMADYEGLGGPGTGVHAFLNSTALGRNVIDAVRAARHFRPDIGSRWAAFGGSLGGLATWAANEQASTYGADLELVGTASLVPVVDISGLPAKSASRTMTRDQLHLYAAAILSLKASTHPDINLQDYMRGAMYDHRDVLVLCNGPRVQDAIRILRDADPADLTPANEEAQRRLTEIFASMAVPQQRTAAPMVVFYGTRDTLVDQAWIETAIDRGCAMGDVIDWEMRPGEGHGDINAGRAFAWIQERFDGIAPIDKCPTGPIRQ